MTQRACSKSAEDLYIEELYMIEENKEETVKKFLNGNERLEILRALEKDHPDYYFVNAGGSVAYRWLTVTNKERIQVKNYSDEFIDLDIFYCPKKRDKTFLSYRELAATLSRLNIVNNEKINIHSEMPDYGVCFNRTKVSVGSKEIDMIYRNEISNSIQEFSDDLLETFDLGLSQISLDSENKYRFTNNFILDDKHQRITIIKENITTYKKLFKTMARASKYAQRFHRKVIMSGEDRA
jgi:hypothetical protein